MAFGSGTFQSAGGAVGDILGGQATARGLKLKAQGNYAEADNYDIAAHMAEMNAEYTRQSTEVKETQAQREIYLGIGRTEADVAGAGFGASGSALDLLRMGAQQGALTKQVLGQQGLITEEGYIAQGRAYGNMAKAARFAAAEEEGMAGDAITNSYITGGFKGASAIMSLFT